MNPLRFLNRHGTLYPMRILKFSSKPISIPNPISFKYIPVITKMISQKEKILSELNSNQVKTQTGKMAMSRELNRITILEENYSQYNEHIKSLSNLEKDLADMKDVDLQGLYREEIDKIKLEMLRLEKNLLTALLNEHKQDDENDITNNNVILEIRPGAGGSEAMLFGGELFEMYSRISQRKSWQFRILDFVTDRDTEGKPEVRQAVAQISGANVFFTLQFERGVHRVQRVPMTEGSGRVHTSTCSVVILEAPTDGEGEVQLNPKDLKVETFRSSGAGGQSVQKTESAVRITHIPTGLTASCQNERSQHQNREFAMRVLQAKLLEMEKLKLEQEKSTQRLSQTGDSNRSEKIRTYNFAQDRITDHRVGFSIYGLGKYLAGDIDGFSRIFERLLEEDRNQRLESLLKDIPDVVASNNAATKNAGNKKSPH